MLLEYSQSNVICKLQQRHLSSTEVVTIRLKPAYVSFWQLCSRDFSKIYWINLKKKKKKLYRETIVTVANL